MEMMEFTAADPYPPIGELAAIGNGHTVALVSRAGTIEWWCPMRFDRPSVFACLLDRNRGGRFDLRITGIEKVDRAYVDDTNVLRTSYRTATGLAEVVDLLPVAGNGDELRPHHALMRLVRCLAGSVSLRMSCAPRFQYGKVAPRLRRLYPDTIRFATGQEALVLRANRPLEMEGEAAVLVAGLAAGEELWVGLGYSSTNPVLIPPVDREAAALLTATLAYWRQWSARCTYEGPYQEAVRRSALTLKMLLFAPSGALVAAPTTSLPEEIGGGRNWDYRYCWLRDAGLSVRALLDLGYREEARAYIGWTIHSTYRTWPALQVVYDVYGRTDLRECELTHLEGYRRSAPVRIGNGAAGQLQLDAYAEVLAATHEYVMRGGELTRGELKRLVQLGAKVMELWPRPDAGIWELRAADRQLVHSKVMCWRALDSLLTMHEHGHLQVPVERFRRERDRIRADIERRGFDETLGSYVQAYGAREADGSLLLLPLHGYIEADHPRMRSTFDFLEQQLTAGPLWYRYPPETDDGLPGAEGTFGILSFVAVDVLARAGRMAEAEGRLAQLLNLAGEVGLYGEEIDAATGAALGNFPQAFTHIGLINAAISIERARGRTA